MALSDTTGTDESDSRCHKITYTSRVIKDSGFAGCVKYWTVNVRIELETFASTVATLRIDGEDDDEFDCEYVVSGDGEDADCEAHVNDCESHCRVSDAWLSPTEEPPKTS